MKKLGIVAVVLAVILLVTPFVIGRVAEKRLNANLDKVMAEAPYFKISERTWNGGWFTSTQTLTIELSDAFVKAMGAEQLKKAAGEEASDEAAPEEEGEVEEGEAHMSPTSDVQSVAEGDVVPAEADPNLGEESEAESTEEAPAKPDKPFRLKVRNDVLHGPILGLAGFGLARVDTHVELDEEISKAIRDVFGDKPALEMRTRVGFFGGGKTMLRSEGRKLNIKDKNVDVSYETFKMDMGYSSNFDSYNLDGGLPLVTVKEPGKGDFSMSDVTLVGDSTRVIGDLYDGTFAFKVKEINYEPADGSGALLIQGAHYEGEILTKEDLTNMSLRMGSGTVKSPQLDGMGLDIKEIHYDFSFRKLHAPTLNKILKGMRDMYTVPLDDKEKADEAIVKPMKEGFAELLAHDPEFGIDRVGLVTPEGQVMAKGVIKLVGATMDDFSGLGMMALMAKLDADITVEADTKTLEKFPNGATMAGMAVDSGYAKREGDKLICRITFKAGNLLVNDKPAPIPGMGGPPAPVEEGEGADAEAAPAD